MNDIDVLTKANQLRFKLGLDAYSPVNIFELSQSIEGLTTVFYPMGENISGMCIKGRRDTCVIAVNSSMSLGRQRFSMAHEFFHKFYDENMKAICAMGFAAESGKDVEKTADKFASYFLMPSVGFDNMAEKLASLHNDNKLAFEDVIRLEQYFGVSHKATMMRLKSGPYITRNRFEAFFSSNSVSFTAEIMGFSTDLYRPSPEGNSYGSFGHYITLANRLHESEMISDGKYEELMLSAFRPDFVYGNEGDNGYVID